MGDDAVILIQIDGGGPGSLVFPGLHFTSGVSTVRGLSLTGFSLLAVPEAGVFGAAILADGFNQPPTVHVEGNFLGLTPASQVRGSYGGVVSGAVLVFVGGLIPAQRNIISGNQVGIEGAVVVQGNYIGTSTNGFGEGYGNQIGINLPYIVGGTDPGAANVITGNQVGINATQNAIIKGNLVGPYPDGSVAVGNLTGIKLTGVENTVGGLGIGEGNVIAYNFTGVSVLSSAGSTELALKNTILSNSIFGNYLFGIDLGADGVTHNDFDDGDTGANNLQNFPVLSATTFAPGSTIVSGGLNSTPSTTFTLQFFNGPTELSGSSMGKNLLGTETVTTNAGGDARFEFTFPVALSGNQTITATATDPDGNTSEFTPLNQSAEFANLSTRGQVGTGDDVMIGGFVLPVGQERRLLIRALGPSLPLGGTLVDPQLEVINGARVLASNDNWRSDQEAEIVATGLAPANDQEAALILDVVVDPGLGIDPSFTVIVSGADGGSGNAILEIYDLNSFDEGIGRKGILNLSTRANVGTGDAVLIGGIIQRGDAVQSVIVRAIGPDLTSAHVPGALQDPVLELRDSDGALVASNDDWRSDQEAEIIAAGFAPDDDRNSALIVNLLPMSYTAIVSGTEGTTGIALVEYYNLDPPPTFP